MDVVPTPMNYGKDAAHEFLRRIFFYGAGATISVGLAKDADRGDIVVFADFDGEYCLAMSPEQAEAIADAGEATLNKFPDHPTVVILPNLIMGLRDAARRAREADETHGKGVER